MDLEAELDEVLREAGWAGMSWNALTTKYAKVETADLKTALDHLIARKSIYRFLRPHGTGRTAAASTLYYSYWPASTPQSRNSLIEARSAP
ncbi:MAG TPA: hypothetical protein VGU20_19995 [Stellaceae bacterium]|nr:hypothetical protein [Stellaceae bacterium]